MSAAACTFCEGDYHLGVGALANSLVAQGFAGTLYAGYRGALPPWASGSRHELGPAAEIRFVDLNAVRGIHFTNYKPAFMARVLEEGPGIDRLFFFDPDITVQARWSFFEQWADAGVALCEDVNPSLPRNHPRRAMWKKHLEPLGVTFAREGEAYFNAGFVGLTRERRGFIQQWQKVLELIAPSAGGLAMASVGDRTHPFHVPDQDALNVAVATCAEPISPMGQDGMNFQHGGGGYVMSHAIGPAKPWRKGFIASVLTSRALSRADHQFMRNAQRPVRLYGPLRWLLKQGDFHAARALQRIVG